MRLAGGALRHLQRRFETGDLVTGFAQMSFRAVVGIFRSVGNGGGGVASLYSGSEVVSLVATGSQDAGRRARLHGGGFKVHFFSSSNSAV
jgi:hypothetical protein